MQISVYKSFLKPLFDETLACLSLIILSPLLLFTFIALSIANKRAGAFFLQPRTGKNGRTFNVIKFKSMTDETDQNGELLPNDERITKIGSLIRKLSIDELPQLINIVKGDMSLIGPRPLPAIYSPFYTSDQFRRHEVRPGITGWSQVHGRNFLPFSKRFELDVWYVDHLSLILDVEILFKSVKNVLLKKDISVGSGNGSVIAKNEDDLDFGIRAKMNNQ